MKICGLQNTTLLDYPGKVACTIFTGGCNFRCPFCHNASLVIDPLTSYFEKDLFDFLNHRKKVLDGVCITGGEPTIWPDLDNLIFKIKALGLLVKLDTNGSNPNYIKKLIDNNLVNYIAMDIKSGPSRYNKAIGLDNFNIYFIKESIDIIMSSKIQYEFRTTLVKGIHILDDMNEIATMIKGADNYYLQSFKQNDNILNDSGFDSFSTDELNEFLDIAKTFSNAKLRGVD